MSQVLINDSNLTNIATAIRNKNGSSDTYLPSEMATAITNIPVGKPEETFNVTPTTSVQTITPTEGSVFSSGTVQAMPIGTQGDITLNKSISNNTATISASQTDTTGYITGTTKNNSTTVSAGELVSGSTTITTNTTTDVTNLASVVTNVPQALPVEVSTVAGMQATLTAENEGKVYKYTGATESGYTNGRIYIVEKEESQLTTPLCFTANTANSTVELCLNDSSFLSKIANTAYSRDCVHWTTFTPESQYDSNDRVNQITLTNIGDKVYFRNDIIGNFEDEAPALCFVMSGSIAASGNCNSIYDSVNFATLTTLSYEACFFSLFMECEALTSAPLLPATTLSNYCYKYMFCDCVNLTTMPKLPATTLGYDSYRWMFNSCTSLVVSDSSGSGYSNALRIPATGDFVNSDIQYEAFYACAVGSGRASDDIPCSVGSSYTYYTQNEPV